MMRDNFQSPPRYPYTLSRLKDIEALEIGISHTPLDELVRDYDLESMPTGAFDRRHRRLRERFSYFDNPHKALVKHMMVAEEHAGARETDERAKFRLKINTVDAQLTGYTHLLISERIVQSGQYEIKDYEPD